MKLPIRLILMVLMRLFLTNFLSLEDIPVPVLTEDVPTTIPTTASTTVSTVSTDKGVLLYLRPKKDWLVFTEAPEPLTEEEENYLKDHSILAYAGIKDLNQFYCEMFVYLSYLLLHRYFKDIGREDLADVFCLELGLFYGYGLRFARILLYYWLHMSDTKEAFEIDCEIRRILLKQARFQYYKTLLRKDRWDSMDGMGGGE